MSLGLLIILVVLAVLLLAVLVVLLVLVVLVILVMVLILRHGCSLLFQECTSSVPGIPYFIQDGKSVMIDRKSIGAVVTPNS